MGNSVSSSSLSGSDGRAQIPVAATPAATVAAGSARSETQRLSAQFSATNEEIPAAEPSDSRSGCAELLLSAARLLADSIEAEFGAAAEILDSRATLKITMTARQVQGVVPGTTCWNVPSSVESSICGYSIEMGNATVSPDLAKEKRFTDKMLLRAGVVSALCVPVLANQQRIGAISIGSHRPRVFKLDELWFVENIAQMVAGILTRVTEERLTRERQKAGASDQPGQGPAAFGEVTTDDESRKPADGGALGAANAPQGAELRASTRRPYACKQKIYPIVANQLPTPDCLYEVRCNDISCGGISFLLEEKPTFTDWVVALGRPPAVTYFLAKLAHVQQITWEGRAQYKVGCRLIDRVNL